MDSPHLLHLGFLLLALAAPHPSIAVSNAGPAKRTQGNTAVTLYSCNDCRNCRCKANDLENFTRIAEIQNETIPDVIVELVTNESHITVCFEQANSCLEGIYGIFWKKAEGSKIFCGILNSGGNGGGNISTEKKNICCEAETYVWNHNPTLTCYTQKSHPKPTTLPVAIAGNPEFLTSKKNSFGILLAFLFVGVGTGWATTFYFLRLRRGQASRQERLLTEKTSHTFDDHLQGRKPLCP